MPKTHYPRRTPAWELSIATTSSTTHFGPLFHPLLPNLDGLPDENRAPSPTSHDKAGSGRKTHLLVANPPHDGGAATGWGNYFVKSTGREATNSDRAATALYALYPSGKGPGRKGVRFLPCCHSSRRRLLGCLGNLIATSSWSDECRSCFGVLPSRRSAIFSIGSSKLLFMWGSLHRETIVGSVRLRSCTS